jgi:hypothetical protein
MLLAAPEPKSVKNAPELLVIAHAKTVCVYDPLILHFALRNETKGDVTLRYPLSYYYAEVNVQIRREDEMNFIPISSTGSRLRAETMPGRPVKLTPGGQLACLGHLFTDAQFTPVFPEAGIYYVRASVTTRDEKMILSQPLRIAVIANAAAPRERVSSQVRFLNRAIGIWDNQPDLAGRIRTVRRSMPESQLSIILDEVEAALEATSRFERGNQDAYSNAIRAACKRRGQLVADFVYTRLANHLNEVRRWRDAEIVLNLVETLSQERNEYLQYARDNLAALRRAKP